MCGKAQRDVLNRAEILMSLGRQFFWRGEIP